MSYYDYYLVGTPIGIYAYLCQALVYVILAEIAGKSRWAEASGRSSFGDALACPSVHALVRSWFIGAIVYVDFTIETGVAVSAEALKRVDCVHARGSVLTGIAITFIHLLACHVRRIPRS